MDPNVVMFWKTKYCEVIIVINSKQSQNGDQQFSGYGGNTHLEKLYSFMEKNGLLPMPNG